jgi:hypothetical protein
MNANGCQGAWDDYDCCVAANCDFSVIDTPPDDSCPETFCATEAVQYGNCGDAPAVQDACTTTFLSCAQMP